MEFANFRKEADFFSKVGLRVGMHGGLAVVGIPC
jgi:hypothetical protein